MVSSELGRNFSNLSVMRKTLINCSRGKMNYLSISSIENIIKSLWFKDVQNIQPKSLGRKMTDNVIKVVKYYGILLDLAVFMVFSAFQNL